MGIRTFRLTALVVIGLATGSVHAQITQELYIKPFNTGQSDRFGEGIGIDGNLMVVTSPFEDSGDVGVTVLPTIGMEGGDDFLKIESGAAYVYVKVGGVWEEDVYIKSSNSDQGDTFGISAAISGNTIVIGAPFEDGSDPGVNGNEAANNLSNSGAVYVFVRNAGVWTQQAYIKASNPGAGDTFGFSVDVDGDLLVVGAPQEDSNATGVNGNGADNSESNAGAAYIFERTGGNWAEVAYLKASNTDAGDKFGLDVCVSGTTVAVGAPSERSESSGVNSDQTDNSALDAGAVYVFEKAGPNWMQDAYVKPLNMDPGDAFGFSVVVKGDTLIVGAPNEDSDETTIDQGDMDAGNNFAFLDAGAVYVFTRTAPWTQQAYLKPPNTDPGDGFGWDIAYDDDLLVVGALREDSPVTGIDGLMGNHPDGEGSGAAYAFVRAGGVWGYSTYIKQSNTEAFDVFADRVAVDGDTIAIAGTEESSSDTGIGANQADNGAGDAGAIYIFDNAGLIVGPWMDEGCALAGLFGDPILEGVGPLTAMSLNGAGLKNARPNAQTFLVFGLFQSPTNAFGGTLKPQLLPLPFGKIFVLNTSAAGKIDLPFQLPANLFPNPTPFFLHAVIQDAAAVQGFAFSNAIRGTLQPP